MALLENRVLEFWHDIRAIAGRVAPPARNATDADEVWALSRDKVATHLPLAHWRSPYAGAGAGEGSCLIEAFAVSGGVATGSELADLMRPRVNQSISLIARWIVTRRVIAFTWRSEMFLPLFQFDLVRTCVRPGMDVLVSELSGAMDEAEVTRWFAQPNGWLGGATPADAFSTDVNSVREAARADRFIAKG